MKVMTPEGIIVVPPDAVRAVDRFDPTKPTTYRAIEPWVKDAPLRATREEAMQDILVAIGGTEVPR